MYTHCDRESEVTRGLGGGSGRKGLKATLESGGVTWKRKRRGVDALAIAHLSAS
jgi:hypothetical protein